MLDLPEPKTEKEIVERSRIDPHWWIEHFLGTSLWEREVQLAESVRDHRRTASRSCHGSSKSHAAAQIALWWVYTQGPQSVCVTTAPTNRQVRLILWQEIAGAHANAPGLLGGHLTQTELKLGPKWFAIGFSPESYNENAFQGIKSPTGKILVIVDEAGGVQKNVWTGVEALLSPARSRLLSVGNPTDPSGTFAEEFKTASVNKFHIAAFDTPNFTDFGITLDDIKTFMPDGMPMWLYKQIDPRTGERREYRFPGLITPEWVRERYEKWGEEHPMWHSRVMGNFPIDTDDALVSLAEVEYARYHVRLEPSPASRTIAGLDVALRGEAESALYKRKGAINGGSIIRKIWTGRGKITERTPHQAAAAIQSGEVDQVRVDAIGVGAFVPQFMAHLLANKVVAASHGERPRIIGVHVGKPAKEDKDFVNIKAESYWKWREEIKARRCDLPDEDEELAAQICSIRWDPKGQGGRIRIEPKEQAAKRGVPSPDRAEACMLTYAGPGMEEWKAGHAPHATGVPAADAKPDSPFKDRAANQDSGLRSTGRLAVDKPGSPWS